MHADNAHDRATTEAMVGCLIVVIMPQGWECQVGNAAPFLLLVQNWYAEHKDQPE